MILKLTSVGSRFAGSLTLRPTETPGTDHRREHVLVVAPMMDMTSTSDQLIGSLGVSARDWTVKSCLTEALLTLTGDPSITHVAIHASLKDTGPLRRHAARLRKKSLDVSTR